MISEIDVLRKENEAVIKVLQINLVRALEKLELVEEAIDKHHESFWTKDLPIQSSIKEYQALIGDLLTIYTQQEKAYQDYNKDILAYLKSFDESVLRDELESIYASERERLKDRIADLEKDRDDWKVSSETYNRKNKLLMTKLAECGIQF